jgi:hypothetical protein
MQGPDNHKDDNGRNNKSHENGHLHQQQWLEVAAIGKQQRQLQKTRGYISSRQEEMVVRQWRWQHGNNSCSRQEATARVDGEGK